MWGKNKTRTAKKGTLGPIGLIKRENKLYKLSDTVRQTYVELENSNIIPQNRETTQNLLFFFFLSVILCSFWPFFAFWCTVLELKHKHFASWKIELELNCRDRGEYWQKFLKLVNYTDRKHFLLNFCTDQIWVNCLNIWAKSLKLLNSGNFLKNYIHANWNDFDTHTHTYKIKLESNLNVLLHLKISTDFWPFLHFDKLNWNWIVNILFDHKLNWNQIKIILCVKNWTGI